MHNKITKRDKRVLDIANKYVANVIIHQKVDIDVKPIDWRTYHKAASTALAQYRAAK